MLADFFWSRWAKEYLPKLTKRSKSTDDNEPIKEGDIVIIVDDKAARNSWTMGKIEKLFPGPDGRVRVADVKTRTSTYRRPVSKLCKMKLDDEEKEVSSSGGEM
ncbi:hypothetical protein JTB14_010154 [Gonioctena quinquepunctata]|nr:hypothetical protein JTB14_010154 [Gonioctena quinquepunctata]